MQGWVRVTAAAALQGGGSFLPLLTLSSDLLLTSCLVAFEMLPLKCFPKFPKHQEGPGGRRKSGINKQTGGFVKHQQLLSNTSISVQPDAG